MSKDGVLGLQEVVPFCLNLLSVDFDLACEYTWDLLVFSDG